MTYPAQTEAVLVTLRRIMRVIDQHSARLGQQCGLTAPQALILKTLKAKTRALSGEVAKAVQLSHATVTDILNRLEGRGLIERIRDDHDRRKVWIALTDAGRTIIDEAPRLLQDEFADRFGALDDDHRTMLVAAVKEISILMGADDIDAAPLLVPGEVRN